MRGLTVGENALGFTTITLHYSASPEKDIQHADQTMRENAQAWLYEAKRAFADPHRWEQEMEISWWISTGTRVYPEFTQNLHAPMPLLPNPRKILYRAWDFGWHAPACLVGSVDSKDRLYVLREFVGKEQSTRDFAQHVMAECARLFPHHSPGWQDFCDPAGQQVKSMESERNEKRDVEVLNSLSIYPAWEYGWSRKDGRSLVHQLLVLRTDQTPSMYVDPHACPVLLQGFLGKYVYPEGKDARPKDEPDESNHPWADAHAALRYLCTGLYAQLGLRRFQHMPILKPAVVNYHGYGSPVKERTPRNDFSRA